MKSVTQFQHRIQTLKMIDNNNSKNLPIVELKQIVKQKKILIVDDDQFNINAAKIILYSAGLKDFQYICDHELNGSLALDKIVQSVQQTGKMVYELILMDQNMPIMGGCEATTKIREYLYNKGLSQPIIIGVTGHTEQQYVNYAIKSGMNQVLSKPVKKEALMGILK